MAGSEAIIQGDLARAVLEPGSYANWNALLDTFDQLRADTPVVKVLPDTEGVFDPFWLITR